VARSRAEASSGQPPPAPAPPAVERRLVLVIGAVVFVDTMFYAAIAPLLPNLASEFGLSKLSAGVMTASYAIGTLVGSLPGGVLAARAGPKFTVFTGLTLLACSTLAFGLLNNAVLLDLARFVEGVGGACSWAGGICGADRPRRRPSLTISIELVPHALGEPRWPTAARPNCPDLAPPPVAKSGQFVDSTQDGDQDDDDHDQQQTSGGDAHGPLAPPELGLGPVAGIPPLGGCPHPILFVVPRTHGRSSGGRKDGIGPG
jgi:hypothetical protein